MNDRKNREPEALVHLGARAMRQVLAHPLYRDAKTIFCYHSTAEEIDTRPLLLAVLAHGKRLCLPRCEAQGRMEAYAVWDMEALRPGPFGILEPEPTRPLLEKTDIDLAIVPALAVDRRGYRIGYGGGYYDRYLKGAPFRTMALCGKACLHERLMVDPWDVPCDYVLTEDGVIKADAQR